MSEPMVKIGGIYKPVLGKCGAFMDLGGKSAYVKITDIIDGTLVYDILDASFKVLDSCFNCFEPQDLTPVKQLPGMIPAGTEPWPQIKFDNPGAYLGPNFQPIPFPSQLGSFLGGKGIILDELAEPKKESSPKPKKMPKKPASGSLDELIVSRPAFDAAMEEVLEMSTDIDDRLQALASQVAKNAPVQVIAKSKSGKEKVIGEVEGLKHAQFLSVLNLVLESHPVLLVGPAGSGKTHVAEQVATAAGLAFSTLSVGMQTSKSDLFGFIHAGGEYVPSLFRKAFEDGGLFLLDELDAGNSNVVLLLNTALANDYAAFPDKMVKRHPDFRILASANTVGAGADHIYVGRNQLDFSTIDRFMLVKWQYDEGLERSLVQDTDLVGVAQKIRSVIETSNIPCVFSTRALVSIDRLVKNGMKKSDAYKLAFFDKLSTDDAMKIISTVSL